MKSCRCWLNILGDLLRLFALGLRSKCTSSCCGRSPDRLRIETAIGFLSSYGHASCRRRRSLIRSTRARVVLRNSRMEPGDHSTDTFLESDDW